MTVGGRARDLVAAMPTTHEHAGLLGVVAAEAAFDHGDAWLDAVIEQLDQNRTLLDDALSRELPQISWTRPQATFLAWLDCTDLGLGDEPARAFLRDGRVALARGLDYGPHGQRWSPTSAGQPGRRDGSRHRCPAAGCERLAAAPSTI